jgi:hypothetical protein
MAERPATVGRTSRKALRLVLNPKEPLMLVEACWPSADDGGGLLAAVTPRTT